MTNQTQSQPQTVPVQDPQHTAANTFYVALIVAASKTSSTSQSDLDNATATAVKRLGAKAHKDNQKIVIVYLTGKRATHTDQENPNIIERTASDFSLIDTAPATPDRRYYKQAPPNAKGREPYITAGRIANQIDAIALITGNKPATNKAENQIINHAKKNNKPIVTIEAVITPTRKDEQPQKAHLPIQAAANRINIRHYKNWQALIADPVTTNTLAGETQSPIYCGAASKQREVKRSPLANQYRYTPNWQKKYKTFLLNAINTNDPEVMPILRKITPTTPLVCWCTNDKECHTDIIRAAAAYVNKIDRQTSAAIVAKQHSTSTVTAQSIGKELKTHNRQEMRQRANLKDNAIPYIAQIFEGAIPNLPAIMHDPDNGEMRNEELIPTISKLIERLTDYRTTLTAIVETIPKYQEKIAEEERYSRAIERVQEAKAHAEKEKIAAASKQNATTTAPRKLGKCTAQTANGKPCTRKATRYYPAIVDRQDEQELCTQHAKKWSRILSELDASNANREEEKTT